MPFHAEDLINVTYFGTAYLRAFREKMSVHKFTDMDEEAVVFLNFKLFFLISKLECRNVLYTVAEFFNLLNLALPRRILQHKYHILYILNVFSIANVSFSH